MNIPSTRHISRRLLNLQEQLDVQAADITKEEGRLAQMQDTMKNSFGCTTLKQLIHKQKELQEQINKDIEDIDKATTQLEGEVYGHDPKEAVEL